MFHLFVVGMVRVLKVFLCVCVIFSFLLFFVICVLFCVGVWGGGVGGIVFVVVVFRVSFVCVFLYI